MKSGYMGYSSQKGGKNGVLDVSEIRTGIDFSFFYDCETQVLVYIFLLSLFIAASAF